MSERTTHLILRAIRELAAASGRPLVKSAHVLAAAIDRAGLLTPLRQQAIYTEVDPPPDEVIARFHSALVALVHESDPRERLVIGNGNFGEPDGSEPPANPLFTKCGLTDRGRALAAQ